MGREKRVDRRKDRWSKGKEKEIKVTRGIRKMKLDGGWKGVRR